MKSTSAGERVRGLLSCAGAALAAVLVTAQCGHSGVATRDPSSNAPARADPRADQAAAAGGPAKTILDTDIGTDIDDAWSLAFVARQPSLELVAVTISDANTPARAKIACKLLSRMGRSDVPVAVGRQTPAPPERVDHQLSWAEDFTGKKPVNEPAAQVIVDAVRKHPGEVTLLAVGPLQNVADALRRDPGIARLFRRVVLMSGNIRSSAWSKTPIAEWNVTAALADAQLVYASGLPLTIVPVDTTSFITLTDAERERVRGPRSPLGNDLEALYRLWIESPETRMTLHDQLAAAEVVRPGAFFGKMETLPLVVDSEGYTRVDAAKGKPVRVAFDAKRDEVVDYFISGITTDPRRAEGATR